MNRPSLFDALRPSAAQALRAIADWLDGAPSDKPRDDSAIDHARASASAAAAVRADTTVVLSRLLGAFPGATPDDRRRAADRFVSELHPALRSEDRSRIWRGVPLPAGRTAAMTLNGSRGRIMRSMCHKSLSRAVELQLPPHGLNAAAVHEMLLAERAGRFTYVAASARTLRRLLETFDRDRRAVAAVAGAP